MGYYSEPGAEECLICGANTFSPSRSPSCIPCPEQSSSEPGAGACTCNVGYAVKNGTGVLECSQCPAGTKSPVGTQCETCPANTYSHEGTGVCLDCPPNSASEPGSATCTCLAGYNTTGSDDTLECTRTPLPEDYARHQC